MLIESEEINKKIDSLYLKLERFFNCEELYKLKDLYKQLFKNEMSNKDEEIYFLKVSNKERKEIITFLLNKIKQLEDKNV